MKKSLFIIILFALVVSGIMIYASSISYNKDGSITQTDSNGNKTTINMDGKTPEGEVVPDVIKKVSYGNSELEIIYSGAMSDMTLAFYQDEGYIKKFINSMIKLSEIKMSEKNIRTKKIKIVISNCRIGKTGYCGRMKRTDVMLTAYKDSVIIDEIVLSHGNILGKNNYKVAAKVCIDRIFKKL